MYWRVLVIAFMIHGSATLNIKLISESGICDAVNIARSVLAFVFREKVEAKYKLFTPFNPRKEEMLEPTAESIKSSSFNKFMPLKVLTHGYMASINEEDIRIKMKDALLKTGEYNVIIVDWSNHNGWGYTQALKNAKIVGKQLAEMLKLIIENLDYNAKDIHIIGHSLGAHVAGWAGERIRNLGRITGLDPAGPCFQNVKNSMRLDYTDAMFVDIIHTDGGENTLHGLGVGDPVGHIDFYPNGGRFQPGCAPTAQRDDIVASAINFTMELFPSSCDHTRSSDYFLESIDNSKCRFVAVQCNSYKDYEKGECTFKNSLLSEMGFHAKKIDGIPVKSKFFLRTFDDSPFCNVKAQLEA